VRSSPGATARRSVRMICAHVLARSAYSQRARARRLEVPMLSLDVIEEALGDSLGLGDQSWSDRVGDAAAEVLFQLATRFPSVIAEGWWRRERRERAMSEFAGWVEVFCRCDPDVAAQRMRARAADARHPIHRDVINPAVLDGVAGVVASTARCASQAAASSRSIRPGTELSRKSSRRSVPRSACSEGHLCRVIRSRGGAIGAADASGVTSSVAVCASPHRDGLRRLGYKTMAMRPRLHSCP
jgi:hypothetical protein